MLTMQHRTLTLNIEKIAFCHGPPDTLEAIKRQINYFKAVLTASRNALLKGYIEDQAVNLIDLTEYKCFQNYNDWFKGNIRAMYR